MSSVTIEKGESLIKEFKSLAELQEVHTDLLKALSTYDDALSVAREIGAIGEITYLACTCCRLSFLLKEYSRSLNYADICVMHDPKYVEVYLWSYKSHIEIGDHNVALTVLLRGYNFAIQTCSIERQKEFLLEVASKIPTLTPSVENRDILKNMELPSEDEVFMVSTLEQLSNDGKWLAVSLLVTGRHLGPKTCLDNFAHNCPARSISVGQLLKSLNDEELKSWGMKLALALLKNKASLKTIEECFESSILHVGVQLALSTGITDLVEYKLKCSKNQNKILQEKDKNGKTAYQRLLDCPDKQSQTYLRLETLLKNNSHPKKVIQEDISLTKSDENCHEDCLENRGRTDTSSTKSDNQGHEECIENRETSNTTSTKLNDKGHEKCLENKETANTTSTKSDDKGHEKCLENRETSKTTSTKSDDKGHEKCLENSGLIDTSSKKSDDKGHEECLESRALTDTSLTKLDDEDHEKCLENREIGDNTSTKSDNKGLEKYQESRETANTTSKKSDDIGNDKYLENRAFANKCFGEGKYSTAILYYKKSISQTTSTKTLAELYGNIAECCIKMKQFYEAIEYGQKSIEYDMSLTKSHIRIGRAKSAIGLHDEAIMYFTSALEMENSFVERGVILTHFSSSAVRARQEVFHIPYIEPSLWIHSAYVLIVSRNWDASYFAFTQFPPDGLIKKTYSLRPFYNLALLRNNGWAMEFLERLVSNGSVLSSIAEGTDESFLHIYFKMILASEMCLNEVFSVVKRTVLRTDNLIFDEGGDSLFHLIVKQGDRNFALQRFLCEELLKIGMSKYLNHRNKKGKLAISYVKGNPRLKQLLKDHMPTGFLLCVACSTSSRNTEYDDVIDNFLKYAYA